MKKSRISVWIILLATAATGIVLFWLAPTSDDDFPHPLNGLFRELHGANAMLAVFMFGYLFADHVQKKLQKKKRHWDGYLHLILWSLLVVSGLLLYYPQDSLEFLDIANIHWYLGLALCLLFPLHFWRKAIIKYSQRRTQQISKLP